MPQAWLPGLSLSRRDAVIAVSPEKGRSFSFAGADVVAVNAVLVLTVDTGNAVTELNENNNAAAIRIAR